MRKKWTGWKNLKLLNKFMKAAENQTEQQRSQQVESDAGFSAGHP